MRVVRSSVGMLVLIALALPPSGAAATNGPLLQSDYFQEDLEAHEIALGLATVEFFAENEPMTFDVRWRIQNALRMVGHEEWGMPWEETIDADRILAIDAELASQEFVIQSQASKITDWEQLWTVDFIDNIPQAFGVHLVATLFDLFNAPGIAYQSHALDCVRANFVPTMCGALIDMGTVSEESCGDASVPLLDPITVQTPELFAFNNVRREILADEYPTHRGVASTFAYVATLAHEFVHDMDASWMDSHDYMHRDWDRAVVCGENFMSFDEVSPTPFRYEGAPGGQDIGEFVSFYASGLSNATQGYRPWEDRAESVTAFLLLPEYFRDRMQGNPRLREKYEYIRDHLFEGLSFSNPVLLEHPEPFFVPDTISQFYIENEVPRFELDAIAVPEPDSPLQVMLGAAILAAMGGCRRRRASSGTRRGPPVRSSPPEAALVETEHAATPSDDRAERAPGTRRGLALVALACVLWAAPAAAQEDAGPGVPSFQEGDTISLDRITELRP